LSPEEASIGAVPVQEPKWLLSGNPGDVADLDEQPRSAGGSDALQIHQSGAGLGDQRVQLLVCGLLALIDPLEVGDQFSCDGRRVFPAVSRGRTVAGSAFACAAERSFFAPPG
jgi:hypothetical protein